MYENLYLYLNTEQTYLNPNSKWSLSKRHNSKYNLNSRGSGKECAQYSEEKHSQEQREGIALCRLAHAGTYQESFTLEARTVEIGDCL